MSLREKVARGLCLRNYPSASEKDLEEMSDGFLSDADAAIAAVMGAMGGLTEGMEDAAYNEASDSSFWITTDIWQAMLRQFKVEQGIG